MAGSRDDQIEAALQALEQYPFVSDAWSAKRKGYVEVGVGVNPGTTRETVTEALAEVGRQSGLDLRINLIDEVPGS